MAGTRHRVRSTLRRAAGLAATLGRGLGDLRRLASAPGAGDFRASYAFALEHVGLTQREEEIRWLWEQVREDAPKRILEIGLDRGGTLFLWTRAAAADAHIVSVDSRPAGSLGRFAPFALERRRFARGGQRVDVLLGTDSHSLETRKRIAELFDDHPIDFLFIDGDHTYEGVGQDFCMYAPLVRPGGLVAFHDVSQSPSSSTDGVARFWHEFAQEHDTQERVTEEGPGFGIGVYRVPTAQTHQPAPSP